MAGLLSGGAALSPFLRIMPPSEPAQTGKKNILIIVFDALTAQNMSLYGYGRETTPNLQRLSERAIVYHNHFAAGNFTTPGTASLLTGVYPWTHRALQVAARIYAPVRSHSLFHAFARYHRIAYSHNPLADRLFYDLHGALDNHLDVERLLLNSDGMIQTLFRNDEDAASLSWARAVKQEPIGGSSYSLFLPSLYRGWRAGQVEDLEKSFPLGLPFIRVDNYFILEDAVDFVSSELGLSPTPFLAYFHFIPPHEPYRTRAEFYGRFRGDSFRPPEKPTDVFGGRTRTRPFLRAARREYDEYLLYVDAEFARLYQQLEDSGLLEDTWLIVTSDHGEMFERGIWAHTTPVLYQPVIRVPLLIFEPGRTSRLDIHTATSAVDLVPTLLSVAGEAPAPWAEGTVLPPFGQAADAKRSVFALEATANRRLAPLTVATLMLIRGRHKLMYFTGYPELGEDNQRVELYDLQADPEELENLASSQAQVTRTMLDELKAKLAEVNAPFEKASRSRGI